MIDYIIAYPIADVVNGIISKLKFCKNIARGEKLVLMTQQLWNLIGHDFLSHYIMFGSI